MSIEENKKLIEEYPFLLPRNRFSDETADDYDYSYTELDDMPDGWRKAFGAQLLKELKEILEKGNCLNEYRICQIKEKFGGLRWYDNGILQSISDEYDRWLEKYENLSFETCIHCGEKAVGFTRGWIMPYCQKCANEEERILTPFNPVS